MTERLYFRPIVLSGADRQADAHSLAGGKLGFSEVDVLTRGDDGAQRMLGRYRWTELSAQFSGYRNAIAVAYQHLTTPRTLICGLPMDRAQVMAVVNLTPDSFSDGGVHNESARARDRIDEICADGAAILDFGGESTRPGADIIPEDEEFARILPALDAAAGAAAAAAVISVDTRKAQVAVRAKKHGAQIFNDVSALTYDPDSMAVAREYAEAGGAVCLMHALGDPKTMQKNPRYDDVLLDVYDYLEGRVAACEAAGIPRSALIVDPGIGFGKTLEHNLALLRGLSLFHGLGCPVLLGASRKRFIGTLSGEEEASRRAPGSVAAALYGAGQGVQILRVHDVRETVQALRVWEAVYSQS